MSKRARARPSTTGAGRGRRGVAPPRRRGRRCCWCTDRSTTTGRCPRASSSRARPTSRPPMREVREETGLRCDRGPELVESHYVDGKGRPKVVRYWMMTVRERLVRAQRRGRRGALAAPSPRRPSRSPTRRDVPVLESFERDGCDAASGDRPDRRGRTLELNAGGPATAATPTRPPNVGARFTSRSPRTPRRTPGLFVGCAVGVEATPHGPDPDAAQGAHALAFSPHAAPSSPWPCSRPWPCSPPPAARATKTTRRPAARPAPPSAGRDFDYAVALGHAQRLGLDVPEGASTRTPSPASPTSPRTSP